MSLINERADILIGCLPKDDQKYVRAMIASKELIARNRGRREAQAGVLLGTAAIIALLIGGIALGVSMGELDQRYLRLKEACIERVECACMPELPEKSR